MQFIHHTSIPLTHNNRKFTKDSHLRIKGVYIYWQNKQHEAFSANLLLTQWFFWKPSTREKIGRCEKEIVCGGNLGAILHWDAFCCIYQAWGTHSSLQIQILFTSFISKHNLGSWAMWLIGEQFILCILL